jgi:hypothetical protein
MNADGHHDPRASAAARSHSRGAIYARFREWRVHTLPDASYQIAPAFWTPAGLRYRATFDARVWPVIKRREPTITGLAYTARAFYLVVVARSLTYEHVARLIHCRALMRGDPDYQEHRGKRVSMLVLCDDCPPAIADFARRHPVRVLAQPGPQPGPGDLNGRHGEPLNVTKPLSP